MITIETPKLNSQAEKPLEKLPNPDNGLKNELQKANEKINELTNQLAESKKNHAPAMEEMIRKGLNKKNCINEKVLKYILQTNDLEDSFVVGTLRLSKIFLGDGFYKCTQ